MADLTGAVGCTHAGTIQARRRRIRNAATGGPRRLNRGRIAGRDHRLHLATRMPKASMLLGPKAERCFSPPRESERATPSGAASIFATESPCTQVAWLHGSFRPSGVRCSACYPLPDWLPRCQIASPGDGIACPACIKGATALGSVGRTNKKGAWRER